MTVYTNMVATRNLVLENEELTKAVNYTCGTFV